MQAVKSIVFQSWCLQIYIRCHAEKLPVAIAVCITQAVCIHQQPSNIHIGSQACMKGILLRQLPLLALSLSITVEVVT